MGHRDRGHPCNAPQALLSSFVWCDPRGDSPGQRMDSGGRIHEENRSPRTHSLGTHLARKFSGPGTPGSWEYLGVGL